MRGVEVAKHKCRPSAAGFGLDSEGCPRRQTMNCTYCDEFERATDVSTMLSPPELISLLRFSLAKLNDLENQGISSSGVVWGPRADEALLIA